MTTERNFAAEIQIFAIKTQTIDTKRDICRLETLEGPNFEGSFFYKNQPYQNFTLGIDIYILETETICNLYFESFSFLQKVQKYEVLCHVGLETEIEISIS